MTCSPRRYVIYRGSTCLDVGTVDAPDDRAALAQVMRRLASTAKATESYRVTAGDLTASAYGDELGQTASSTSMPEDGAAKDAQAARQAAETRARAEDGLRKLLADKVRARAYANRVEAQQRGRGTAGDVAREHAGGIAPRQSQGGHVLAVDTVHHHTERSHGSMMVMVEVSGNCANCGEKWRVSVMLDPFHARSCVLDYVQRAHLVDRLRQAMAGRPCRALRPTP